MKNDSQLSIGSVEGAPDARLVGVAAVAFEQFLGLLAAIAGGGPN